VLLFQPLKELKNIQRRAALWIIEAFHTSPIWEVEIALFLFTSTSTKSLGDIIFE